MDKGMLGAIAGIVILYHIGNLIQFFAFLFRDQLYLRIVLFIGILLQGIYHYLEPGGPNGIPLFWKTVFTVTNLLMIIVLFSGRFDFGIPRDLRALYDKIKVLAPGDFRKLVKISSRTVESGAPLLVEGQKPDKLHYLLKGEALMRKGEVQSVLGHGVFLGEVAFLTGEAASATVTLQPGAECITWPVNKLRGLMNSDRAMEVAMRGVFNYDLAAKLAISVPIASFKSLPGKTTVAH